jgi:uncharacterized membrane protein YgcG
MPPSSTPQKKPKAYTATERVHFNHWLLLLIVGTITTVVIGGMYGLWLLYALAGQTKAIVSSVPKEFNIIRGVNTKALRLYKAQGVQNQKAKYYDNTAEIVYWFAATELGISPETSMSYFISASEAYTEKKILYFLTEDRFDTSKLGGGQVVDLKVDGMSGVKAVCPWDRLVVVAYGMSGGEAAALNTVVSQWNNPPEDNTYDRCGWGGTLATRGQIWSIMLMEGQLKTYMSDAVAVIKEDSGVEKLKSSMEKATMFATWTSFGSAGVRLGAGIELGDRYVARDLVVDMQEGPLGKADESELPNKMKNAVQFADPKQNGEFLQYLEYRQLSSFAFIRTKIGDLDKAQPAMDGFNNASRGLGSRGGGGGFPGGGGGGFSPRPGGR